MTTVDSSGAPANTATDDGRVSPDAAAVNASQSRDGLADSARAMARRALLSQRLRAAATTVSQAPAIASRPDPGRAPLSVSQSQLWYLAQAFPESTAYYELVRLDKTGPFDPHALEVALNAFVKRHEAWRTTFSLVDDEPQQIVHAAPEIRLPVTDLSGLGAVAASQRADELAEAESRRPYVLEDGPLLRPLLVRLAEDQHRLYLALHHLIFDGVTLYRILLPEIVALYEAALVGAQASLPAPVQYPDYALWERAWVEGPVGADRVQWWRHHLEGLSSLDLPQDHPRPSRRQFHSGVIRLDMEAHLVDQLSEIGRASGATLFHVLAALYGWWLGRYAGSDNVGFATMSDLRQETALARMAGYCVAPVVIRADLSGRPTLQTLVDRLRGEVLDGMDHVIPFEKLVKELGRHRDPRVNPVFQAALVLEPPATSPHPQWLLHVMDTASVDDNAKFDLSVELDQRPDGRIHGRLVYDADLFDGPTAALMARHWSALIARAALHPDRPLDEVDRAEPATVTEPAQTPTSTPWRDIAQIVAEQAARRPDAIAVVAGSGQLTYRQLDHAVDVVAGRLLAAGAGPGVVVAAMLDRSVELVVGLLGVLRSGAAYLPLNPREPVARSDFLIADSQATILLTNARSRSARTAVAQTVVSVDAPYHETVEPGRNSSGVRPDDLAYIIYTSGSTGRPKGVLVEHGNLIHLVTQFVSRLGLSDADVIATVSSYTFDMSVGDIFGALSCGARLVLASSEQATDHRALSALLDRSPPTLMAATPTTWAGLVRSGWAGDPGMVALAGGEPLPDVLVRDLATRCRAVWNGYGPTETTVYATCGPVQTDSTVTVGHPLPTTVVRVVDANIAAVPDGVPGEVVIGGAGVTRGYLNRPDETAQRFVGDPDKPGGRLYRTGDRGRFLADGRLQLLGRYDEQVKLRGFRIEPAEIESVLAEHPRIAAASVAVRDTAEGERSLTAWVVAEGAVDDVHLRSWLRNRLPDYMVPAVIVRCTEMPRTASGKVDRAALPEPRSVESADPSTSSDNHHRSPQTPTQRRLAALWSKALPAPVQDVDADFFDLGGHSLLAAHLIAEVGREFEHEVSLPDFLEHGTTIAGLAALLDASDSVPEEGADAFGDADRDDSGHGVITRSPGRSGSHGTGESAVQHVFFVYPDAANAISLRHLSRLWGTDMVVRPLLPEQVEGRFDRSTRVERLAADLIDDIRRTQTVGPYAIAGYSFGGLVAYEIARQLAECGERIQWLAVLDTASPEMSRRWFRMTARMSRVAARPRREQLTIVGQTAKRLCARLLVQLGLRGGRPLEIFDFRGALALEKHYLQQGHDLDMELFVTGETVAEIGDAALGWSDYHGGRLRVHALPGVHTSILDWPDVQVSADLLLDSLNEARDGES